MKESESPLVGLYFINKMKDEYGRDFRTFGRVKAALKDHWYLLQMYTWIDNSETNQVVRHINDMTGCRFYQEKETWEDEIRLEVKASDARAKREMGKQHHRYTYPSTYPSTVGFPASEKVMSP